MTEVSSITQLGLFTAQTSGDTVLSGGPTGTDPGYPVLGPVDPVERHQVRGVAACA